MNWPAVNSDIAEGVVSIGMAPSFDAYGAKGDGTTDDTVAMQAAIDAAIDPIKGGTICGAPGKNYLITSVLYLPSRTKCIGQGAQISYPADTNALPLIKGMFIVGTKGTTNGIPAGDELKATDVEISGWKFFSPTGGKGGAAISCQPGSERVLIRNNHFESDYFMYQGKLVPPSFVGIFLGRKRLRDIVVDNNTFYKVSRLILVRGSEGQTGTPYNYDVKGPTNVTAVSQGSLGPAAPGTTYFMVPTVAPDGDPITPLARMLPPYNWSWSVVIIRNGHPFDSYALQSPSDNGNDAMFNGADRVTFGTHIGALPSDPIDPLDPNEYWGTRFFIWNPAVDPCDDLVGLSITNNRGHYTSSGPVALFCQVNVGRQFKVPEVEGLRNVIIDNNRFAFNYLPGGNYANINFDYGSDDPALVNFALWSEDFDAISSSPPTPQWTKTGITTAPGYWGPRYDTTRPAASRLIESATTGFHRATNPVILTNATSPWTASIFLQAQTRRPATGVSTARLTWTTAANVGGYVDVDLAAGTIVGSGGIGGGAVNFSGTIPYGDNWWRVFIDCNILSTSALFTLSLTNGTAVTSYTGDTNYYIHAFGLQVEQQAPSGNQYFIRNCTPSAYKPTHNQPTYEISTTVISINGTVGFSCCNNIISASCGQGIHIEDTSSNGVIANNHISECTFGIRVMDCHNIVIENNTLSRFYKSGITLAGGAPTTHNYALTQWVDFQGSISGTTLTVTSISNYPNANLLPNADGIYKDLVSHGNYPGEVRPGTRILNQISGTAGSTGTYTVSKSQTVTLPTTTFHYTTLSAGFGGQCDNVIVRNNLLDVFGYPSVQAAYWIDAAYNPFVMHFDNPPAIGLSSVPVVGAIPGVPVYDVYSIDNNFIPLLSSASYSRAILVSDLGTPTVAKTGQRRLVSDALTPTYRATVGGGGTNTVSVICTGTAWVAD